MSILVEIEKRREILNAQRKGREERLLLPFKGERNIDQFFEETFPNKLIEEIRQTTFLESFIVAYEPIEFKNPFRLFDLSHQDMEFVLKAFINPLLPTNMEVTGCNSNYYARKYYSNDIKEYFYTLKIYVGFKK